MDIFIYYADFIIQTKKTVKCLTQITVSFTFNCCDSGDVPMKKMQSFYIAYHYALN